LNSYVGRDFMTAIENHNQSEFIFQALLFIGVFAASTLVSSVYRFAEERLGLMWREWATRKTILRYADRRVYYRLKSDGKVENPDQRIAEDIRACTGTTISFVMLLLNAGFTVIAFSSVLWSISPLLFLVAVVYAAGGTLLIYRLGRPLVRLNFDQLDKEAKFRASLIHLRENAEAIALVRREAGLVRILVRNLGDLTGNLRRIIRINLNVNSCATGYNWMIQIIPALVIAPLFIDGKVQFGVITQSAIAFGHLLGAFSIIITQFQSISSFTAVVARLTSLMEAGEQADLDERRASSVTRDKDRVVYKSLSLRGFRSGRVVLRNLSLAIPPGRNFLVCGQDETARMALFRATAGLWDVSEGQILRPRLEQLMFLTERPYLPSGTLREIFTRPWAEEAHPDDRDPEGSQLPEIRILESLHCLGIDTIPKRFGGMDTPQNWESNLTLAEQQLLVAARLIAAHPRFAFLDKPSTALTSEQISRVLAEIRDRSITYVVFEEKDENPECYDMVLELEGNGLWTCYPVEDGQIARDSYGMAV
jgi:putative ATP-binding cassette transporter